MKALLTYSAHKNVDIYKSVGIYKREEAVGITYLSSGITSP